MPVRTWLRRVALRTSPALRQRPQRVPAQPRQLPQLERLEDRCLLDAGFRTIDGTGNNLLHPEWGSTNEQLIRRSPAEYGDGVSAPAGADRPGPRIISNALVDQGEDSFPNDRDMSGFIYAFGQFLDHDLDLINAPFVGGEALPIPVPAGDPHFDPTGTGTQIIPFTRSTAHPGTGTGVGNPRQQTNLLTAWIDGSQVYGSDAVTAGLLRSFVGGRLQTSPGNFMPLDPVNGFLAGDIRVNENVELMGIHTLFMREHNRLADRIASANPGLDDEEIYQRARALVGAELQVIVYKEWLPALLGPNPLRAYTGYRPTVNPNVTSEFATAGFRLGHSLLANDVEFIGNDGRAVRDEISLREAFFNIPLFLEPGRMDEILKYLASSTAEEIDNHIVGGVRNLLFFPGGPNLDLASLNIQRGRDHGMADYNRVRVAYGLPAVHSFAQISSDPEVRRTLRELYGNVNNIDLWVGMLAEDHVRGSSTGPLVRRIVTDVFERVRDGDRFWYQRVFSGAQLVELERTTFSDILRRNTTITNLQDNAFFMRAEVRGQVFFDRNGDGNRDPGEFGLPGVLVQLLNDEGDVIAAARSGLGGRYSFDDFDETGDFHVRIVIPPGLIVTTDNPQEFLVSRGDVTITGMDFGLRVRGLGGMDAGLTWGELPDDVLAELYRDLGLPESGRPGRRR